MREEQTKGERVKKRGAYKVSHIRIIEEPPKIDYDELERAQDRYTVAAITSRIAMLKEQVQALENKLQEITNERTPEPL